MITEADARAILTEMVRIPSPSGAERAVAEYIAGAFAEHDLAIDIDAVGNLIASRGSEDGPTIVLLGHIDTVPDPIPTRIEGDLLYGRGSVDAKGAFATFLVAVANLPEPRARYIVIGAVEEETSGSRGANHVRDRYDPAAVFIGEPSGYDGLTIGYKGRIAGTYTIACDAGHSAGQTRNACEIAMGFWQALQGDCERLNTGDKVFESTQLNCDRLDGDARYARLRFSVRTPPDFKINPFLAALAERRGAGALQLEEIIPASVHPRSSPPARALSRAIRDLGATPRPKVKTGTSDMNTVAKSWRAPMVAYGPGDSALDHTTDEHIDLKEFWTATQILGCALGYLERELTGTQAVASLPEFV